MYGIELIAVLSLIGGIIAYVGDKLGTKIGKKRLSIFGLRPKHTSIVITILTGIMIVSATMGVLTLVSRDVRTALFGMEALQGDLKRLSQEADSANKALADSQLQLDLKNKEYLSLTAKVRDSMIMLQSIGQELASVTAERDQAAAALASASAQYAAASAEIQNLQQRKAELDQRVTSLSQAKTGLEQDVAHLTELTDALKDSMQAMREGSILYQAGQIMVTSTIPVSPLDGERQQVLRDMIYKTNQTLLQKLGLADKKLELLWIPQQDFEQAVAALAQYQESAVVRIVVTGNTVYGQPVIGHLEILPHQQVYAEGDIIYQETLRAPSDSKGAEERLLAFLQQVNSAAIKQGILPDPLAGTVGSLSGAQFYDSIEKIKRQSGRQIELTAIAAEHAVNTGPLRIDIRVRAQFE